MKKTYLIIIIAIVGLVGSMTLISSRSSAFDPLQGSCDAFLEFDSDGTATRVKDPNAAIPATCSELLSTQNEDPVVGSNGVLTKVTNLVSVAVAVASVIIIIVSGITMTLSSGDPSKVKSSRDAIIYAVVGIVVVAVARTIVLFVFNRV